MSHTARSCLAHGGRPAIGAHRRGDRGKLSVPQASCIMAECPSMKSQSNDRAVSLELCWPWNPLRATRRMCPAPTALKPGENPFPKGSPSGEPNGLWSPASNRMRWDRSG